MWISHLFGAYLGATPDGIVNCDCCGEGLLEIKCPYSYCNSSISEINDPHFYLEKDEDGNLQLKKSHDYFIQVQAQMIICNKQYCDFVCWTTTSIHIEHIEVDPEDMKSILPKFTTFFY